MIRQNLRIGDCEIYFNEVSLGQTRGGIDFSFEREFEDLMVDKFASPLDMALKSQNLTVKVNLAEAITENLEKAIPEGRFAQNGGAGGDSKLGLGNFTGYLLFQDAGLLRLHPRRNAPTNLDEDIYIWKAVSADNVEMPFKVDEQRLIPITFRALADETQADGEVLGRIGNATIS